MWRSKKFILIAVLAAILLVGSIGGVVLAQTGDEGDSTPETQHEALLDKVCQIYNEAHPDSPIDCDGLKDAITEAQSQLRTDALTSYLEELVAEGKITQGEADDYLEWLGARPDMPNKFGFGGHGGMHDSSGMHGSGGMRHFGGMRGFGPCVPVE